MWALPLCCPCATAACPLLPAICSVTLPTPASARPRAPIPASLPSTRLRLRAIKVCAASTPTGLDHPLPAATLHSTCTPASSEHRSWKCSAVFVATCAVLQVHLLPTWSIQSRQRSSAPSRSSLYTLALTRCYTCCTLIAEGRHCARHTCACLLCHPGSEHVLRQQAPPVVA